jgi:hypothetical protein
MSDPFERLVRSGGAEVAPDLDAIRLRAHRLRRRRQTGLASAGAAAMAIIAVVGVLLTTGPGEEKASRSLADAVQETDAPARAPAVGNVTVDEGQSKASRTVGGSAATAGGTVQPGSAPAAEGETTSGDSAALGAARAPEQTELEATLAVEDQMLGRGKTFTLKVCNVTSGTVSREFSSSQRYDFEVSKDDKLVWRWSDGQMFSQVIGSESWKPKECKSWSENWDASTSDGGRAPAGDYVAVGILKAQPELRTSPKAFSVSAL